MFYSLINLWKLKAENSRLKSIVDNMFDGIGVLDNKGNVTQANKAFAQMLGYEEEEQVIGKNMTEFTVKEDVPKVISAMEKGAERGFIRDLTVIGITKDGKNYHASINAKLVKGKTGDAEWIGVVRDTTELANLEKEKNELIENLQKALTEVKTLRGILPLCSFCKKIRDDKGYWEQVDVYIHKYSEADISHSICPECMKKHYPDDYE